MKILLVAHSKYCWGLETCAMLHHHQSIMVISSMPSTSDNVFKFLDIDPDHLGDANCSQHMYLSIGL